MDLLGKLNETSNLNRLNAVDAAYVGSPYAGSNFKAKWQGYNDDGKAVVRVGDQNYAGTSLAQNYTTKNSPVVLRVARGYRSVNY